MLNIAAVAPLRRREVGILSKAPGPYWVELVGGLLTMAVAGVALVAIARGRRSGARILSARSVPGCNIQKCDERYPRGVA